jgi:hypothetical protein
MIKENTNMSNRNEIINDNADIKKVIEENRSNVKEVLINGNRKMVKMVNDISKLIEDDLKLAKSVNEKNQRNSKGWKRMKLKEFRG